jgi:hypothetical protein
MAFSARLEHDIAASRAADRTDEADSVILLTCKNGLLSDLSNWRYGTRAKASPVLNYLRPPSSTGTGHVRKGRIDIGIASVPASGRIREPAGCAVSTLHSNHRTAGRSRRSSSETFWSCGGIMTGKEFLAGLFVEADGT